MRPRMPTAVPAILATLTAAAVAVAAAQTKPPAPPAAVQQPATEIYSGADEVRPGRTAGRAGAQRHREPGPLRQPAVLRQRRPHDAVHLEPRRQADRHLLPRAADAPDAAVHPHRRVGVFADGDARRRRRLGDSRRGRRHAAAVEVRRTRRKGRRWCCPGSSRPAITPGSTPAGWPFTSSASRRPCKSSRSPLARPRRLPATSAGRYCGGRPGRSPSCTARANRAIVKEYDPASRAVRVLVPALEGSPERDAAWGPDGTLFMTRGGEVLRVAARPGGLSAGRRSRNRARCRAWRCPATGAGWPWWPPKGRIDNFLTPLFPAGRVRSRRNVRIS